MRTLNIQYLDLQTCKDDLNELELILKSDTSIDFTDDNDFKFTIERPAIYKCNAMFYLCDISENNRYAYILKTVEAFRILDIIRGKYTLEKYIQDVGTKWDMVRHIVQFNYIKEIIANEVMDEIVNKTEDGK